MATKNITGWNAPLGQFLNWFSTTEGLSDLQRANAQRVIDQYTRHLVAQRNRGYDDGVAHNQREQEAVERILSGLADLLEEAVEQAQRGEITGEELLKVAKRGRLA